VMQATSPGFRLWDWNMRKGQWVCVKSKLNIHYCKWGQFENCGPLLQTPLIVYSPLIAFFSFLYLIKAGTGRKSSFIKWITLNTNPTIYHGKFYHTVKKIIIIVTIISCISTCLHE